MSPDSLISAASILAGFGVTVLMFRISREITVAEKEKKGPNWIPWADYLILSTIVLSLLFVLLPLTFSLKPGPRLIGFASASCSASAILLAAYPFAILDHYRIGFGANREGERQQGEPIEKAIVIISAILASITFGALITYRCCCAA